MGEEFVACRLLPRSELGELVPPASSCIPFRNERVVRTRSEANLTNVMKRFITLLKFTSQGTSTIKESPERAKAFTEMATAAGCKVNALYWTMGGYDGILSFDAPDEAMATALMVKLSSAGNVTTQTLQAFPHDEIDQILEKVEGL
jgi:uncharacterized protein with GYD domain